MYTVWALAAAAAVVVLEVGWWRTGLFRMPAYWVTLAVTWAFQVPVDGWLTKLSAPIVIYNPAEFSGIRFPWDIPIEDFAYGFALVTLALLLWVRQARPGPRRRRRHRGSVQAVKARRSLRDGGR